MKRLFVLGCVSLACGCASHVDRRIRDRSEVWAALDAPEQGLIRQSQLAEGMTTNAVWIAWGEPHEALAAETAQGEVLRWNYFENTARADSYWEIQPVVGPMRPPVAQKRVKMTYGRFLERWVTFESGRVVRWAVSPQR